MKKDTTRKTQEIQGPNYHEMGFVDGNFEDKYNVTNPVSKVLVRAFIENFTKLAKRVQNPGMILEIGSGEGYLLQILAEIYPISQYPRTRIIGCDLSDRVNNIAQKALKQYPHVAIQKEHAENLTFQNGTFDAVICCEVLEHVEKPRQALGEIYRILKIDGVAILSVPREPIWRLLNIARFRYLTELGNTPGHLNHWSISSFKNFVKSIGFTIITDESPFPWTMLLVQKKAYNL